MARRRSRTHGTWKVALTVSASVALCMYVCRLSLAFLRIGCIAGRDVSRAGYRSSLRSTLQAHSLTTDDAVPEEHRGLHSALYGEAAEGSEAAHRAVLDSVLERWPGKMDGSELLPVSKWLEDVAAAAQPGLPPLPAIGLYALYEDDRPSSIPWYIGYSRRVPTDLARHLRADSGAQAPSFARIRLLGDTQMWTRARLEEMRQKWAHELALDEVDSLSADQMGQSVREEDLLAPAERQAFEEKKWKLQLAMGINLVDAQAGEEPTDAERRKMFLRAVEGDDWSAVIDAQTSSTIDAQQKSSPFLARPGSQSSQEVSRELTMENVHAVLETIRPVLVADGGDIQVLGVNVDKGAVMVGLIGACMSCPAAPSTMESGIEKTLRDHFGRDVVREVIRIDSGAESVSEEGIRRSIEAHLESLQLESEGASAKLAARGKDSDSGYEVEFYGPAMLFQLVESSLTYRFPELSKELQVRHVTAA
eukprot:CAMPEP_0170616576 /NCGR_PEP_ID=MMETSP0224-20130122/25942_1 /TAXON_ID=285029 /ORGANISM="Togula jolla, Strain CCCM 725" /LENGTH=476 /DNA_ID=CAMNT_0010942379 /DNA_START=67 /DNA_END=1497 /DNA_ORIENTATION=-